MNARLKSVIDQLEEIYANLPTIACKGKCWNSCGVIDMSTAERKRITQLGVNIPLFTQERAQRWANDEPLHCPALNRTTLRCDVYEARPLICRVWGVSESMPCPHGCEATRIMSDVEVYEYVFQTYEIGGHPQGFTPEQKDEFLAILKDPDVGPLMARFIRGDRSVEAELMTIFDRRGRQ